MIRPAPQSTGSSSSLPVPVPPCAPPPIPPCPQIECNRRLLPRALAQLPAGGLRHGSVVLLEDHTHAGRQGGFKAHLIINHRVRWVVGVGGLGEGCCSAGAGASAAAAGAGACVGA